VAELGQKYGISDRMPRPIIPGEKLAVNKRIAEQLANKAYRLELAGESSYRIWADRKAAWALDDLDQDVRLIYERMGVKGLESILSIGKKLAREVEQQIRSMRMDIVPPSSYETEELGGTRGNSAELQGNLQDSI
jgi:DNA polymerase/3'-5' exonuclease PolX